MQDDSANDQPEEAPEPRGRAVPVPGWWVTAARAELRRRSIKNNRLAELLAEQGITESMVQRCLSVKGRRITTIEAVVAISDFLKFPHPVVLARSFAEALAIQGARSLHHEDIQAVKIATGVGDLSKQDQSDEVDTVHANSGKPGHGKRRRSKALDRRG